MYKRWQNDFSCQQGNLRASKFKMLYVHNFEFHLYTWKSDFFFWVPGPLLLSRNHEKMRYKANEPISWQGKAVLNRLHEINWSKHSYTNAIYLEYIWVHFGIKNWAVMFQNEITYTILSCLPTPKVSLVSKALWQV